MYRKLVFTLCLILNFSAAMVVAKESEPTGANVPTAATEAAGAAAADAKTVRGMSVLGNNEAPMSLFIVPWKSSKLGMAANLSRTLNEHAVPVDRDVFLRELSFYQASVAGKTKPD